MFFQGGNEKGKQKEQKQYGIKEEKIIKFNQDYQSNRNEYGFDS